MDENNGGFDLAQLRAEMSPIGQEALDAAVARLLLKQHQELLEQANRRIRELEKQKSPAVQGNGGA